MTFREGGRYAVYGADNAPIGIIDGDEFIRSDSGQLLYRIDGTEVYTAGPNAKPLGELEGLTARTPSGGVLFTLKAD